LLAFFTDLIYTYTYWQGFVILRQLTIAEIVPQFLLYLAVVHQLSVASLFVSGLIAVDNASILLGPSDCFLLSDLLSEKEHDTFKGKERCNH
jgi:hypothetical protein